MPWLEVVVAQSMYGDECEIALAGGPKEPGAPLGIAS